MLEEWMESFPLDSCFEDLPRDGEERFELRNLLATAVYLTGGFAYSHNLAHILGRFPTRYEKVELDNHRLDEIERRAIAGFRGRSDGRGDGSDDASDTILVAAYPRMDVDGRISTIRPVGNPLKSSFQFSEMTIGLVEDVGDGDLMLFAAEPCVEQERGELYVEYNLRAAEKIADVDDLPAVPVYDGDVARDYKLSRLLDALLRNCGVSAHSVRAENYRRLIEGLRAVHCPRSFSDVEWAEDSFNQRQVAALLERACADVPIDERPDLSSIKRGGRSIDAQASGRGLLVKHFGNVFIRALAATGFPDPVVVSMDDDNDRVTIVAGRSTFVISTSTDSVDMADIRPFVVDDRRVVLFVPKGVGFEDASLRLAENHYVACLEYDMQGGDVVPHTVAADALLAEGWEFD